MDRSLPTTTCLNDCYCLVIEPIIFQFHWSYFYGSSKSALNQVMAWHLATSHWPRKQCRSRSIMLYGVTRWQWVVNGWVQVLEATNTESEPLMAQFIDTYMHRHEKMISQMAHSTNTSGIMWRFALKHISFYITCGPASRYFKRGTSSKLYV